MPAIRETTMRAVRYRKYGPPEVLEVAEVPVPAPAAGQVLVKVHASSVNPVEAQVRAGRMRPVSGFRFPKGIGQDFTGEVVAVGAGADGSLVGRDVWGCVLAVGAATTAEYVCVKESLVGDLPPGADPVEAAALPTVGLAALAAVRAVGVGPGRRALVVGASGGIGSVALQLCRALGAEVAAVSAADNAEFCAELGATETYDYADLGPLAGAAAFDAVIDLHGTSLGAYRGRLGRGGRMVTLAARGMGYAALSLVLPGPRVRVTRAKASRDGLAALAGHVTRGELRPVVAKVYPMERIAEAHRAAETGHSRGKRVVQVVTARPARSRGEA
ncbi:NAD(P)-dependent alcohol dehydrogenase [Streptomyces avicenniae]|uniref:NAD(P)-dependent alcohol dehydrogenase n=1 Tax=Streptomyces avicenniae TaxID=500153 RepID=UPI00069B04F0|nr:NAD(P)-dependent alcohol dehydrogenase [Streptomyces avicenniae]